MINFAASLAYAPKPDRVGGVGETAEFRRIRDAIRVNWEEDPKVAELVTLLTDRYKKPKGTMQLRPVQAAVMQYLCDLRGCFAPIRTGGGKTLISLLAPTIFEAERPVLLVPASLQNKTRRERAGLAEHWQLQPMLILSYQSLGRVAYHHKLLQYNPDLVIGDECHFLKNTKAGVTRVVRECIQKCKPAQLWMSGSVTSRSLREYWHLIRWCLRDGAPLPSNPMELQRWSWAIDSKISDGLRIPAGALLDISPPEDDDPQDEMQCARRRYGRRLMATPGVVGTGEEMPPCGLVIQVSKKDPSPVIAVAVKKMRETWETPCGIPFELATELWRHERELSCGLYYRWTNQPPGEWLQTRQAWSRFMRGVLSDSRSLFTPQAIVDAIDSGSLKDGGLLAAWRAAKPTFKPVTEPVWLCDETLKWAADWLESQRGICWVVHTAFGDRLSELTGVPYFAREGKSAQGITIDQWDGPAIAGPGCSNGFNLQGTPFTKARHWRNLVVTSPTKNGPAEQMLSRTHRDGQEEDDVEVTFLQTLEGDERALTQAVSDAKYVEESTRQPQRLTVATWI